MPVPLSIARFGPAVPLLGHEPLAWNPTDEWIFPTIVTGAPFGDSALGRWYMYYSPHDAPGGIGLAVADELGGPWHPHPDNPLISATWPPHHAVNHVASPHACWLPGKHRLLIFYHGENDTTRLASSADGVRFAYEGVSVGAGHRPTMHERSYARVFPQLDPRMPVGFVMLFMGREHDTRCIHVARSADARRWRVDPEPLIVPPPDIGIAAAGPWLHVDGDRLVVVHHIDRFLGDPTRFDVRGDIYRTEVSWDLRRAEPPRLLQPADPGAPDDGRAADPVLIEQDDTTWLVYLAGRRLRGRICARALCAVTP